MSAHYTCTQYPTREVNEMWEKIFTGKMAEVIGSAELETALEALEFVMQAVPRDRTEGIEAVADVTNAIERMVGNECFGFDGSVKDVEYVFLEELYKKVMGTQLSDQLEVTTPEWILFFRKVTKEQILQALAREFGDRVPVAEQEKERMVYLKLLFEVRDSLKECMERKWDLFFTMEYPPEAAVGKSCFDIQQAAYYERLLNTPSFG